MVDKMLTMAQKDVKHIQLLRTPQNDGLLPAHGAARKGRLDVLKFIFELAHFEGFVRGCERL
jgi:hypothetical protein